MDSNAALLTHIASLEATLAWHQNAIDKGSITDAGEIDVFRREIRSMKDAIEHLRSQLAAAPATGTPTHF